MKSSIKKVILILLLSIFVFNFKMLSPEAKTLGQTLYVQNDGYINQGIGIKNLIAKDLGVNKNAITLESNITITYDENKIATYKTSYENSGSGLNVSDITLRVKVTADQLKKMPNKLDSISAQVKYSYNNKVDTALIYITVKLSDNGDSNKNVCCKLPSGNYKTATGSCGRNQTVESSFCSSNNNKNNSDVESCYQVKISNVTTYKWMKASEAAESGKYRQTDTSKSATTRNACEKLNESLPATTVDTETGEVVSQANSSSSYGKKCLY